MLMLVRSKNKGFRRFKMWLIVFKVNNNSGTEGRYKNILIARRHLKKSQKRYIGTHFDLKRVNKKGGF